MKKLFKNRKMTTGSIAILTGVILLLSGLTLAWFTSVGAGEDTNSITTGTLSVTANLEDGNIIAEPGVEAANQKGTVQNTGSIAVLAKLDINAFVTLKNGAKIENDEHLSVEWQKDGGRYGMADIAPEMGLWIDGTTAYLWGEHNGDLYVAMYGDGNRELPFAYTAHVSGEMGNDYQDAMIDLAVNWEATQLTQDGAIAEMFGIEDLDTEMTWLDGFHEFEPEGRAAGRSAAASAKERLAAIVEGMPACAFRNVLAEKLDVM